MSNRPLRLPSLQELCCIKLRTWCTAPAVFKKILPTDIMDNLKSFGTHCSPIQTTQQYEEVHFSEDLNKEDFFSASLQLVKNRCTMTTQSCYTTPTECLKLSQHILDYEQSSRLCIDFKFQCSKCHGFVCGRKRSYGIKGNILQWVPSQRKPDICIQCAHKNKQNRLWLNKARQELLDLASKLAAYLLTQPQDSQLNFQFGVCYLAGREEEFMRCEKGSWLRGTLVSTAFNMSCWLE